MYSRNIYLNPSGMYEYDLMLFTLDRVGADHTMWGEDYPFVLTGKTAKFLEEAPISVENKEKIGHSTAERIFKL